MHCIYATLLAEAPCHESDSSAVDHCRQQELLALLLEEGAEAGAVPRVTRRATVRIMGAMARAAEPVQDPAWNATALRHLQGIAASLHFYSDPALTQTLCRGGCLG